MRQGAMVGVLGAIAIAMAGAIAPAAAQQGLVNPRTLSWDEPQFNDDAVAFPPSGSELSDLADYRVEISNAGANGPFTFRQVLVPAPSTNPTAGSRVQVQVSQLGVLPNNCPPVGTAPMGCQYHARVVARDLTVPPNVSKPSDVVPFFLRDSTPPGAASNGRADP